MLRLMAAPTTRRLLLVWHSRTGLAQQMADACERGANDTARELADDGATLLAVVRRRAADATKEDLLTSDGFLFCSPENLASTSGEMLEFFHRTYYSAFLSTGSSCDDNDHNSVLAGRPYALAIAAGSDGTSAARQQHRICRGWRLRRIVPEEDTLIVQNGQPQTARLILQPKTLPVDGVQRCSELGGLIAAHLLL
uniref:NADPH-dependent FMN reductase-like domain-containing protein n=1 Tax=Coccolithus braarudii TaxID=221442 RepID=A0A7S0L6N2_9EUKA